MIAESCKTFWSGEEEKEKFSGCFLNHKKKKKLLNKKILILLEKKYMFQQYGNAG